MFADFIKGHAARPLRGMRPVAYVLVLGWAFGLTGCGGCSSHSTTSPRGEKKGDLIARGRDLLDPAITMMQPDHLGIDANPSQPAGLLNQWRAVQLEETGQERLSEPLSDEVRKLLEQDLSADAAKRAERDDFTAEDAKSIRTAMLMKAIVDHVAQGVDGELNRAQVVFDYVTRNIQLVSDEDALALTPYEILIFGEGTAADRAWVFAELLRQLNQDAVIVKPRSAEASESEPAWFVGAVAKQELRLFDPLRSTPVPARLHANSEEILPATLADLSKPAVLESLTGGTETPLSPEMFENVRLELIGNSTLWSPRHANLQKVFTGGDAVVISQQLTGASGDFSSIVNRIASLQDASWNREDLRVWSHPESRMEQHEAIDSQSDRWKPFQAPQQMSVDPQTGQVMLGNHSKLQLKTRTEQLMGDRKNAIQGYLRVQLAHRHMGARLPGDIRTLHADAAEDAYFWSGVCQMEQGLFDEAANKFQTYIKQAERFTGSRHGDHARVLLARCLIQLGQMSQAMEALKPLTPASPQHATAMFLRHALGQAEDPAPQPDNPQSPQSAEAQPSPPAIAEKPAG